MGLLDDAIREHLDLKRRRGADPTEIERLEQEALGPVRRGPGDSKSAGSELAHDEMAEPDWDEPYEQEDELEQPRTAVDNGEPLPPISDDQPGPRRNAPIDQDELPPFDEPQAHAAPAPHPAPSEPVGHETAEYDVEHAVEQQPSQAKDDMLEETPEFLQDTPDHDRLWFEQRPPKDFDFDG